MARREVVIPYRPRKAFASFHERVQRWAVLVAHRRAGKTVAAINDLIRAAVTCKTVAPQFAYMAPFRSQAKFVAWEYLKFYSAPIMSAKNESELLIDLINGARIRLFGADNADAMRGIGLDGVFMDEFGDFKPSVWGNVVRPLLSDKQGWAVFAGTPKGKNQFWDIFADAKLKPSDWFSLVLKASETGILPQSELSANRAQLTQDQYDQEFECSFEAAILGAFYGVEMRELEQKGHIRAVPYQDALPVHTAWDIGRNDDTAVWWFQMVGKEIHVIDHFAISGSDPDFMAGLVLGKPYRYGKHWLPHDAMAKTFASGKSTFEQLEAHFKIAHMGRVPSLSIQDGINATRMTLPNTYFDAEKCKEGIEALKQYQREYDEDKKAFRQSARRDWTTHSADAFRYLAIAWREEPSVEPKKVYDRPLMVGPQNEATLNDMWAFAGKSERKRI